MITSQVSYYVGKMHNLQTIQATKKLKIVMFRTKLSIDVRTLKTLANHLRS